MGASNQNTGLRNNFIKQASENPIMGMRNQGPQGGQVKGSPETPPRMGGTMDPLTGNPQPFDYTGRFTGREIGKQGQPYQDLNMSYPQPVGPGTSVSPSGMQAKSPSPKGAVQAPPPPPPPRQVQGRKGGKEMRPQPVQPPPQQAGKANKEMRPNMEADRRQMQSQLAVMPKLNTYSSANQVKQFNPASVLRGTGGLF